ncbi:MAG: NAD(P)/FAD-dependent oxidoreductase [Deltaproteobacteria bacterium]
MKTFRCHVLVVGAGPAGSSAAAAAAAKGLKVLLVERKAEVGIPVRCAEYIPAPLLGDLDLDQRVVVQPVKKMKTFVSGESVKETQAPGYIIRREQFDQALARQAERAGADLLLSTRVLTLTGERVLLGKRDGSLVEIEAEIIIGADGPHSTVGRWIQSMNRNLMPALQVSVPLAARMDHTEVYFQSQIYGGYGWLFPKGETANVGLGMKQRRGDCSIHIALDQFVEQLAQSGKIRKPILGVSAGWIPAEPPRTAVSGRVLLAGDAAGQTNAITGAGVAQAVLCGRMAGECAARALQAGDLNLLQEYDTEWRGLFEETLQRAFERRQELERGWDTLEDTIKSCWVAFRQYYARP